MPPWLFIEFLPGFSQFNILRKNDILNLKLCLLNLNASAQMLAPLLFIYFTFRPSFMSMTVIFLAYFQVSVRLFFRFMKTGLFGAF